MQQEWIKALEAHCTTENRASLLDPNKKTKFVCDSHFNDGFKVDGASLEEVLANIRGEFCGPTYMAEATRAQRTKRRKAAEELSGSGNETIPSKRAKMKENQDTESSIGSSEAKQEETKLHLDKAWMSHQFDLQINAFLKHVGLQNRDEKEELLREYIMRSNVGQKIVMKATLAVVENIVAKQQPWEPRRTLVKSFLETMDTLKLKVKNVEISMAPGISLRTVSQAKQELRSVRAPHWLHLSCAVSDLS
jgi:hypothetical protein